MADKTVYVSFTPPGAWAFSELVTRMHGPGKVHLEPASGQKGWTFVDAHVVGGGDQFPCKVKDDRVTVDDKHTAPGSFPYTVTVRMVQGGTSYTSPGGRAGAAAPALAAQPPQILNEASFDV